MRRPDVPVASPCIGICHIDDASGYCEGCWRTREEIARWGTATDIERLEILQSLRRRRRAAGVTSERGRRAGRRQRRG